MGNAQDSFQFQAGVKVANKAVVGTSFGVTRVLRISQGSYAIQLYQPLAVAARMTMVGVTGAVNATYVVQDRDDNYIQINFTDPATGAAVDPNFEVAVFLTDLAGSQFALPPVPNTPAGVPDSTALQLLNDTSFFIGAEVFVQSFHTYFILRAKGALVQTPGLAYNSLSGRVWVRSADTDATFATQANWFVNDTTGDENNDGLTAATPLLTHQEIVRRVGQYSLGQTTNIFLNFATGNTAPINIVFNCGPGGRLVYFGQNTATTFTGAFTAVTAINRAANTGFVVEDTSIPVSWTASNMINTVNSAVRRLRITGGARAGAIAYAGLDVGAKQACTSNWAVTNTNLPISAPGTFPQVVPQVGDPYVLETLTQINEVTINIGIVGNFTFTDPIVTFFDIDERPFKNPNTLTPCCSVNWESSLQVPAVLYVKSGIGRMTPTSPLLLAGAQSRLSNAFYQVATGIVSLQGGLCLASVSVLTGGTFQIGFDAYSQGGSMRVSAGAQLAYDSFLVQGVTGSGVFVLPGGTVFGNDALFAQVGAGQIYGGAAGAGKANTRFGLEVQSAGAVVYSAGGVKPSVTGTLGNTSIGGAVTAYAAVPFLNGYDGITVGTGNGAMVVPVA